MIPSLPFLEKVEVSGTASGVAASGNADITIPLPEGKFMVGTPILVSKSQYVGDVNVKYVGTDGIVVNVTNSDSSNAQDLSVTFAVWVMPEV